MAVDDGVLSDFQLRSEYPSASKVEVGLCKIEFFFPHSHSLKEKRHAVLKVKQKIRDRFKISANEVGWKDKWQRATIAFAVLGEEAGEVQSIVDKVISMVQLTSEGDILDIQMEIVSF